MGSKSEGDVPSGLRFAEEVGADHHVEAFGAEDEPGGEGVGVHEGGFSAGILAADLAEDLVEERNGLGGAISRRLR